jgi:hypothetical protein
MLKRWSSAFIIENFGHLNWFTSCRRYLITSYIRFQGLYVITFQLVVPMDRKQSYPNLEAHPHMGPHIWPDLQCKFHATPLPFSHTPSTGINRFQSKSQLTYQACWSPMGVSNQVVSLYQRLKQQTVFNKLISMGRTTSLVSAHNFKIKPFPRWKWEPNYH